MNTYLGLIQKYLDPGSGNSSIDLMTSQVHVLIIDDESSVRKSFAAILNKDGHRVYLAKDASEAIAIAHTNHITVALVDVGLPDMNGLQLIGHLQQHNPHSQMIVMTGNSSFDGAVEATKLGALNYLSKPVTAQALHFNVQRAIERHHELVEAENLRETVQQQQRHLQADGTVVHSPALRHIYQRAREAALMEANILITGETGTGKDVLANYIHRHSQRKRNIINALNCAAIADGLVDAELFGHNKGAFTGADSHRIGVIEASNNGTLLLDEIGDISLNTQSRLLRVLENGTIRRLGNNKETPVNVRFISATHRDLNAMIQKGTFRADLFHRLMIIHLHIPPLRQRPADIVPLAKQFLAKICIKHKEAVILDASCQQKLVEYEWPGNARELRNAIERAWFQCRCANEQHLTARHISFLSNQEQAQASVKKSSAEHSGQGPVPIAEQGQPEMASWPTLRQLEDEYIDKALAHCKGNRRQAAALLDISERQLYRRLKQQRLTNIALS
jgi:two-component system response regulator HydG